MFSRRLLIFIGLALFFAINLTVITMSSKSSLPVSGAEKLFIAITSPVQSLVTKSFDALENVWDTYFLAVFAFEKNVTLSEALSKASQMKTRFLELELENERLKKLVNFTGSMDRAYVAAQIIARDPSPWFKTIMIDKGAADGVEKGNPVVVSEGIVGQVVKVSPGSSRVLLMIDRNSAVDALVQNSRVRGIVRGSDENTCAFTYALRKEEVNIGEMVVSSGMDQVFPKGLKIGHISTVTKTHSQLFQDITIETSVDFDKIEEVLVLKNGQ